jgi:hypothetical protein
VRKLLVAIAMVVVLVAVPTSGLAASGTVIYDSTVSPLPGNLSSFGPEAYAFTQFGDEVSFASNSRMLQDVTVTLSSWACQSGSWFNADCVTSPGATFAVPITFNLYQVGTGDAVGALIASQTQTFQVPYRPSADNVNCTGQWYDSSSQTCYNGFATNISFDFSSLGVHLPDSVIYGISYNTTHFGPTPIGESASCFASAAGCPYDSLNIAVSSQVVVGSKPHSDGFFWDTTVPSYYADGGAGGVGRFRLDTSPSGLFPAVQFTVSVPAPTAKDQCKNGGWQQFDSPHFKNQGDCIQFVNTGK